MKGEESNAQEHPELVSRRVQMNEDDSLDQPTSNRFVRPILRLTQHNPKLASQILEALVASLEAIILETSQQELDPVRQEGVVRLALDETFEDLEIRRRNESLEDQHKRDHVLVLSPTESKRRSTSREVVHRVGDRRLIGSDASNLSTE